MGILNPEQIANIRRRSGEGRVEQSERTRLNLERSELRADQKKFEDMMAKFRAVHTSAWDAIVAYKKSPHTVWQALAALERALHKADHLWEGRAGCSHDPGPKDQTKNSG